MYFYIMREARKKMKTTKKQIKKKMKTTKKQIFKKKTKTTINRFSKKLNWRLHINHFFSKKKIEDYILIDFQKKNDCFFNRETRDTIRYNTIRYRLFYIAVFSRLNRDWHDTIRYNTIRYDMDLNLNREHA